jgi:response regulator RpfG family c-di-GMP phosphodiesterase
MKNIYTICYVSKASLDLTNDDIEKLFDFTATTNSKLNVSGMLLHSLGNFFQVLEGEESHLLNLYEKIKEDLRHRDIYEVYNKKTNQPVFTNYDSKFDIVKTSEDLEMLITYLNQDRSNSTNNKLKRLLQPFAMLGEF